MSIALHRAGIFLFLALNITNAVNAAEYDNKGREIIRHTIVADPGATIRNVVILAGNNNYGIVAKGPLTLENVFIDASICIRHPGVGLHISSSKLNCDMGIEYTSSMVLGEVIIGTSYVNRLSNYD